MKMTSVLIWKFIEAFRLYNCPVFRLRTRAVSY